MKTKIIKATYKADYIITFELSNGDIFDFDFYKFLSTNKNLSNTQFLNKELFKKFKLYPDGDIEWTAEHGTMDFNYEHLPF